MTVQEAAAAAHVARQRSLSAVSQPRLLPGQAVRRIARLCLLLLPSILALLYFGVLATAQYVSESQFVLRTADKPAGGSGFGALLEMSGIGHVEDDVYAVQAFLTSRNAATQLAGRLPVQSIYGLPNADFVARYPSVFYGPTAEEFYKYLNWMVSAIYNSTTGIMTLKVHAFMPGDARAINLALLQLAEETVNQMNARMREDAMRLAQLEVKRSQDRLVNAQLDITRFRNSELMIDASGSAIVVVEVIARLTAELSQLNAQIREISDGAVANPQLPSLRRRAEALDAQISAERQKISDPKDGLADQLARYERLVLNQEFAKEALASAERSLEIARMDARRQQLYLERIVEPAAPDRAMAPERLRLIATVIGLNLVVLLVGWLIMSGLREHIVEHEQQ